MERISVEDYRRLTKKGNKYHNEKTFYKGDTYDSKREADYARTLDTTRHAVKVPERVVKVRRQVPYPVIVEKKRICVYVADFVVEYGDGREEVVDVKGFRTEVYKIKKKLVEATYKIKIIEA